jgi:hypothetical protein
MRTVYGLSASQDSGANAPQTLTIAASAGSRIYVSGFEVATSGNAVGADIVCTLTDGATTKWKSVIGSGAARGERTGLSFTNPVSWTQGNPVVLTVTAGGASVVTSANIEYYVG